MAVTQAAGDLVDHEHAARGAAAGRDLLQEVVFRHLRTHRFHHHAGEVVAQLGQGRLKGGKVVVFERQRRALEFARHALRLEAGEQVAVEGIGLAEVGGQIPVMPAVVAAESHAAAAGGGAGNAHAHGHGVAPAAGVADLAGPRVHGEELVGEFHLLRVDQGAVGAEREPAGDRGGDVQIGIA